MKIAKKITLGGINNVRGGFKNVEDKFLGMRIIGIASYYKESISATMGVSYMFSGEARAYDKNGDEIHAPAWFLPEPAQGLLKSVIDGAKGSQVEFGFDFYIVPNEDALLGYTIETLPLLELKSSPALETLTHAVMASHPKLIASSK
jgi:hypothetical protein